MDMQNIERREQLVARTADAVPANNGTGGEAASWYASPLPLACIHGLLAKSERGRGPA